MHLIPRGVFQIFNITRSVSRLSFGLALLLSCFNAAEAVQIPVASYDIYEGGPWPSQIDETYSGTKTPSQGPGHAFNLLSGGVGQLTDGRFGAGAPGAPDLGYEFVSWFTEQHPGGVPLLFDLGSSWTVSEIGIHVAVWSPAGAVGPESIDVSFSTDGATFSPVSSTHWTSYGLSPGFGEGVGGWLYLTPSGTGRFVALTFRSSSGIAILSDEIAFQGMATGFAPSSVPEPGSSLVLFSLGLFGWAGVRQFVLRRDRCRGLTMALLPSVACVSGLGGGEGFSPPPRS